jgi:hypothetical protein
MRFARFGCLLLLSAAPGRSDEFSLVETPIRLIAPASQAEPSLLEARVEPTKREVRFDDVLAAERWEQGFLLTARLPVTEALSLRQELHTGLQTETVLGDELSSTYHDALAMLERTAVELLASERLRLAVSAQQQWLATNSVPFAEIVTYGGEAKYSPGKTTTAKLQLEVSDRAEVSGAESDQETYRLSLEQELVPKWLSAAGGAALVVADDALTESVARRYEASMKWTPLAATALTLGGEHAVRESTAEIEARRAYGLKVQQQLFAGSKLELQAGCDLHTRSPLDGPEVAGAGWNLGASSDFAIREDWRAGIGVRYREEAAAPQPEELSFTLSVKGKF